MTYKKQFTILSGIIAALAVIFITSFIFDPERRAARSSVYAWLNAVDQDRISGINITNNNGTINLSKNGNAWFVSYEQNDYPAQAARVEDLIAALTKRAQYPVRSSNEAAHERLSLTEDTAARITVSAGAGLPLVSLLIGQEDITGQQVYLRKQGENEIRSGENIFSVFTTSTRESWYNLRLFPEYEQGTLAAADVQRLSVYFEGEEPRVFSRNGETWTFSFELANPDMGKVDAYIRDILGASGSDFVHALTPSDKALDNSRIELELGNGTVKTIRLGPPGENGQRMAAVSGVQWVYTLPGWQRLFLAADDFAADAAETESPEEE